MRFITGLKNLSKNKVLLIIVIIFILSWFFFLFGLYLSIFIFSAFIFILMLGLAAFTFVLLVLSLFFNLDERTVFVLIISIILFIPIAFIFRSFMELFFGFCFISNLIFTAFFAFKFCIDTSTTVDDYLYKKKASRIFLRIVEFIIFLLLTVLFVIFTVRLFRNSTNPAVQLLAIVLVRTYLILIVIDVVLFVFALILLISTKKFPAYLSFFYLLTFIYMLYSVISFSLEFQQSNIALLLSFIIDLFIFLYLLGSMFERVEYIKEKIKILGADTIALFIILMKSLVQVVYIAIDLGWIPLADAFSIISNSARFILLCFDLFTLLIGLYVIFSHKAGKSSKKS